MYDAITNKRGDLLIIHFSDSVDREQTAKSVELVRLLMPRIKPGFTAITDMGRLTRMDFDCAEDVGKLMDLCNEAKVAHVLQVIPKPGVDIGWNILSQFHYNRDSVRINTFPSFYQAMKTLLEDET